MGVARWGQNDNIPPEYWPALKRAATERGSDINADELAEYCAKQAGERRQDQSCA